jgi:hypothetical protein
MKGRTADISVGVAQAADPLSWGAAELGSNATATGEGNVTAADQNSSWVDIVFVSATSTKHAAIVSALAKGTGSQGISASQVRS